MLCAGVTAYGLSRVQQKISPELSSTGGKKWQKLLRVAAVVLAIAILCNPELLAFGFLGDAALFDIFVLLLGVRLEIGIAQMWNRASGVLHGTMRMMAPRMSYLLLLSAIMTVGEIAHSVQKVAHRVFG